MTADNFIEARMVGRGVDVTRRGGFYHRCLHALRAAAPERALMIPVLVAIVLCGNPAPTQAGDLWRAAKAAYARQDYVKAGELLIPLAERGDPASQAYLGFMFEHGRGLPQNYTEAAYWYRRSGEQGFSTAQYTLGLLYDKGFGVPQDPVESYKWLILAAGSAPKELREYYTRLRDSVSTKLTRGQIAEARHRAIGWAPKPEQHFSVRGNARLGQARIPASE
jgi:hypothetical protein